MCPLNRPQTKNYQVLVTSHHRLSFCRLHFQEKLTDAYKIAVCLLLQLLPVYYTTILYLTSAFYLTLYVYVNTGNNPCNILVLQDLAAQEQFLLACFLLPKKIIKPSENTGD